VAPHDGRPRIVYDTDDDLAVELSGLKPSSKCRAELHRLLGGETRIMPTTAAGILLTGEAGPPPNYVLAVRDFWIPRYYGLPIPNGQAGMAPVLLRPPLFSPWPLPPRPVQAPQQGVPSSGLSSGSLGFMRNGVISQTLSLVGIVIGVILLPALPAVSVGLSANRPELGDFNVQVVDLVNS
jgi:hypothetical protein